MAKSFEGKIMKININDICDKKTVTRDDGEKINDVLRANWNKVDGFQVDFDDLLVASVSFLDEAFGRLALEHTKEDLQEKLRFENIQDYDKALLNDILLSRFRQKELGQNGHSVKRKRRY
jgi:ABC-type phosphate transport system auxiliary subunit